jgi:hypothetical protein
VARGFVRVVANTERMMNLAIGVVALVLGVLFVLFWGGTLGVIVGIVAIVVGLGLLFRGYRLRATTA